tara:strand:+ start:182 stop:352 length:171 start_codon:yes stop_codon:yes gene_type:complete
MAKDNKYEKLGLKALDKGWKLYEKGQKALAKKEFDKANRLYVRGFELRALEEEGLI